MVAEAVTIFIEAVDPDADAFAQRLVEVAVPRRKLPSLSPAAVTSQYGFSVERLVTRLTIPPPPPRPKIIALGPFSTSIRSIL